MNNTICYLNTDLDLVSPVDLAPIAKAFEAHGVLALHVTEHNNSLWYATFENDHGNDEGFGEPELAIAAMLVAVESLELSLRSQWDRCTTREFNIGYDCGAKPWAFNQGLSVDLLSRMARVGTTLRITLYPPEPEEQNNPPS